MAKKNQEKKPNKTGRPKVIIDWDKVDNFLKAGCNGVQIAAVLGCSPDTLYRTTEEVHKVTFTVYSQQKKESGNALIHAKQFQAAMDGDRTMLIWLGKQRLEQKEKSEVTGKDGESLSTVIKIGYGSNK